jgi:hypothetical protein
MTSEEDRIFEMFRQSLGNEVTVTSRRIDGGKAILTMLATSIPLGTAAQKVITTTDTTKSSLRITILVLR